MKQHPREGITDDRFFSMANGQGLVGRFFFLSEFFSVFAVSIGHANKGIIDLGVALVAVETGYQLIVTSAANGV